MDNIFTDYELLGAFVDQLIAKKYPGEPASNYKKLRERSIRELDRDIVRETFASMPPAQVSKIKSAMERGEDVDFDAEFDAAHLDIEQITARAAEAFGKKFLGGENGK